MQSRGGKPLRRYFPEVEFPKGRYVLDGELVIIDAGGREEFNRLQMRLHPAESRVKMLAEETPALFRAFDVLAVDRRKLTGKPFAERRAALEELIAAAPGRKKRASGSVEITPLYKTAKTAEPLLLSGEGVIAKELDATYKPGQRKGMGKGKRVRTIECVVMGWRPGKDEGTGGSPILGLSRNGTLRPLGLGAGEARGDRGIAHPRPLREGQAAADWAHLGAEGEGEEGAGVDAQAVRDGREGLR